MPQAAQRQTERVSTLKAFGVSCCHRQHHQNGRKSYLGSGEAAGAAFGACVIFGVASLGVALAATGICRINSEKKGAFCVLDRRQRAAQTAWRATLRRRASTAERSRAALRRKILAASLPS
jgi:hypothetical protein